MILKKVGVLSVARIVGGGYAVFGLVVGFFLTLVAMLGTPASGVESAFGVLMGAGAVVLIPAIYGLMGFVVGATGAVLFNLTAGLFGGIEMTFAETPGAGEAPAISVQWPEKSSAED